MHYTESLCAVSGALKIMEGLHILSSSINTYPSYNITRNAAGVILKHLIPDYRVDWFSLVVNLVLLPLLSLFQRAGWMLIFMFPLPLMEDP